jgi:hypothetical protein
VSGERRLAGDADDALGLAEPVERAARTLRARVTDVSAVVRDARARGVGIRGGADPTVALAPAWRAGSALATSSTLGSLRIRRRTATVAGGAAAVCAITRVAAVVTLGAAEVIALGERWRRSP